MRLYRVLNKHHRRLGLQPFIKAIRDFHGQIGFKESALSFSKALDCFYNVLRIIDKKIDRLLGRGDQDSRLLRSCPNCMYNLKDEAIPYSFLCAADGNFSLKRFKKAGTVDNASFESSYFVSREEVATFAHVAQVRKKGKRKAGDQAEVEDDTVQADKDDANMEIERELPLTGRSRAKEVLGAKESGELPQDEDPFAKTFEGIVSECTEKWKANADDHKKTMWECFDESGIFALVCRHGILLLVCDIVQSGEQ